ncbi:D-xylose transport system permease protein [Endobacter medicaginis]|uniref:Xylose transport system permease protein XylH n=1 Tax=Endobacter medicaginis TaxID=1181271 RepID=A0A839UYD0_9PROT|nr:sugar ABC transporter permease [Endobacter medicaginis]MBB3173344.1 D-xylose transport system permease protein [Endobacter medicaginis]MCX5476839.1 sugar ABC transporter permease [Endobacter medicaginis]NVN30412.1 sugar ABC transporter permease [Endobacter medicaginis]
MTQGPPPAAISPAVAEAAIGERRRTFRAEHIKTLFSRYKILALLVAIALLWALFAHATDGDFLTARNLSNLLRQMAITGMLACGMVFVIIAGEIDLSVGSLLGLLGGISAILDVQFHLPLALNIAIVVLAGGLVGAFNGYWVAWLRVPSFIVTLAGLLAFRGILLGITGGVTIAPVSRPLVAVAQSYLPTVAGWILAALVFATLATTQMMSRRKRAAFNLAVPPLWADLARLAVYAIGIFGFFAILDAYRGVPLPVLVVIVLLGVLTVMARRTVFGRRIYAIGGNIEATRLSGVNVQMVKLLVFVLMGVMAALAGISTTARLAAGSPSAGSLQELDAIASCIIGGTSMRGGAGTVFGALTGALIMATLDNGMSMLGVDTYWQMIVKGGILLLAVWLDVATTSRR